MENGYDTSYILNRFWQGNTVPDFYLLAKDEIERRGHISFTCDEENVNVYQPILAYIFKASRVSVRNMDTNEDIEIDGLPYLKTFIQGYQEGINYFEHDFKAFYSPFDTDKLVAAIKSNYFDTRLEKEGKIGWEKVKKFVPVNLNHKTIKEEGYFSGIVSRVEEIVSKHPQLFQDFYNTQKKKDSRYFLTTFENYQAQTSEDFERVKDNIDTNGHFIVDGVKVYSPELAFIFCSNALLARNLDTQKETNIKGYDYIKSYVEGYNDGIKYFDSKYSKEDERDIHINYFHSGYKGNQGWNIIRTGTINPPIITNESIKEMGYYAGIVNRVELIQKEYPKSFENFDKCEHDLPPQKIETKTEQETPKKFIANEYALAYIFDVWANSKQIPTNSTEGGYDKKALIQKGAELYQFDKTKDTFYRAVRYVATFDLNKQKDLISISQRWLEGVKALSIDWNKTEKYLKEKQLIGD